MGRLMSVATDQQSRPEAYQYVIKDMRRSPFEGIDKPEPLKDNLSGFWSRRINDEHRIVYAVERETVVIISCRGHYD